MCGSRLIARLFVPRRSFRASFSLILTAWVVSAVPNGRQTRCSRHAAPKTPPEPVVFSTCGAHFRHISRALVHNAALARLRLIAPPPSLFTYVCGTCVWLTLASLGRSHRHVVPPNLFRKHNRVARLPRGRRSPPRPDPSSCTCIAHHIVRCCRRPDGPNVRLLCPPRPR